MLKLGDVVSYMEMCTREGVNLQRGMNYRLRSGASVLLMSLRPNAPYSDRVENEGEVLIYEGHDAPRSEDLPNPKEADQPERNRSGSLTQNGLFYKAAIDYLRGDRAPETVRIYEKLMSGIWVFNGIFNLTKAWCETSGLRSVFKFRLELIEYASYASETEAQDPTHERLIPSSVKLDVWKRDGGECILCGSQDNLHFDHIIPYSKGGSSLTAQNVQLLCARHNLAKSDRIE